MYFPRTVSSSNVESYPTQTLLHVQISAIQTFFWFCSTAFISSIWKKYKYFNSNVFLVVFERYFTKTYNRIAGWSVQNFKPLVYSSIEFSWRDLDQFWWEWNRFMCRDVRDVIKRKHFKVYEFVTMKSSKMHSEKRITTSQLHLHLPIFPCLLSHNLVQQATCLQIHVRSTYKC